MITLVHSPRSRSSAFLWLLEEVGEPYRIQYVSIRRGDGSGSLDATNPHPPGKVPLLLDDAAVIFEQSAIALYVADKFPRANLGAPVGDPERGNFVSLLAYYSGVVEPSFTSKATPASVEANACATRACGYAACRRLRMAWSAISPDSRT